MPNDRSVFLGGRRCFAYLFTHVCSSDAGSQLLPSAGPKMLEALVTQCLRWRRAAIEISLRLFLPVALACFPWDLVRDPEGLSPLVLLETF